MMVWYGTDGWHPWAAILMGVGLLLFWMAVIAGIVWLVRASGRGPATLPPDPDRILKERLARGEIDAEEYERTRELIHSR